MFHDKLNTWFCEDADSNFFLNELIQQTNYDK